MLSAALLPRISPYMLPFLVALLLWPPSAIAATYNVTSNTDPSPSTPAGCSIASSLTPGTLRWAVESANASPGADTIYGIPGTVALNSMCDGLSITGSLTLKGNGLVIAALQSGQGDILTVDPGALGTVYLMHLELDGGGPTFTGNRGIVQLDGKLAVYNVKIQDFVGPTSNSGHGAGILVDTFPAPANAVSLSVLQSYLVGNRSTEHLSMGGGRSSTGPTRARSRFRVR